MVTTPSESHRIFVSYVREDTPVVDRLVTDLKQRGVEAWYDRNSLMPGMRWKEEIRRAIQSGDLFLACFSTAYINRSRTYMNEELEVAFEEIRQRSTRTWFIPILLSGVIPDIAISAHQRLRDFQYLDLTTTNWASGVNALVTVVTSTVGIKAAESRAWMNDAFPPTAAVEHIHYDRVAELLFERPVDYAYSMPRYLSISAGELRGDIGRAICDYRERVYGQLTDLVLLPVETMVLTLLLRGPLLRPASVHRFFASISECVAVTFPQWHGDSSLPHVRKLMRECFDHDGDWQLRLFKVAEEPIEAMLMNRALRPEAR